MDKNLFYKYLTWFYNFNKKRDFEIRIGEFFYLLKE